MSSEKELKTINFHPVRLTLDDVYVIEEMLKGYFGECNILAGWKELKSADELLEYISKRSMKIFFLKQFCFRKIIFKSPAFRIKLLRSKTIIELPEDAVKDDLYRKLIDYLDQRAEKFRYFLFLIRIPLLMLAIIVIPFSVLHIIGFENIYLAGMGIAIICFVEILAFVISRVLYAQE